MPCDILIRVHIACYWKPTKRPSHLQHFLIFFLVKIYKNPPLHILEVHILLSFLSPFWEAAYIIAWEV